MAWSENLLQASFKGVAFDIEGVSDNTTRSVAFNEYPYTDGADAEDLGLHPTSMRFAAVLWGDDYETRLQVLLAAIKSADAGELVHPVFGSIKRAICVDFSVDHHATLRDACKLTLSFVQAEASKRIFMTASAIAAADKISEQGAAARTAADAELVARVEEVTSGPVPTALLLKAAMNQALSLVRRLSDTTAKPVLLSNLDPVLFPTAYTTDVRALQEGALQGLAFGGRNLAFEGAVVVGTGLGDFDRAAVLLGPAAITLTSPDANGLLVQAHARVHSACSLAEAAAIVLTGELDQALLDRAELERLAAVTRSAIQAALEAMRTASPGTATGASLRALAYQVQAAARAVIEQRPPVVRKPCPVTGPLRLVAHALYGDHTRAAELVRLNGFGRTLVAAAGQELSLYAR